MVLATTVVMLAALVAFQKPVAVDVEIHRKAVISEQQSFDPDLVEKSLARNLANVGIDVVTSPDLPRLKVYIMIVKVNKSFPATQTATIAAYTEMLEPTGNGRPSPLSVQAASCSASAGSGVKNTEQQVIQLALARCIDKLAGQISSNVVRFRKTKFVG